MVRRPLLSQDIQQHINQVAAQARPYWETKDYSSALKYLMLAWDLIPDPKTQWDYYAQTMSKTIVKAYVELKDFEKAEQWLHVVRQAYDALDFEIDPTVDFINAELLYRKGDTDSAFKIFDQLYKKYKKRPFVDEDPQLWAFYQQRK